MKFSENHKTYKLIALFLVFFIMFSLMPQSASALEDPNIVTAAALLVDSDADQVLYSKNADARRAPASLTKVMTVMLAIEAYERGEVSLTDVVTVSDNAYYDVTADGSSANLKAGEEISFEDLLYCAMIASANEACNVLAEYVAGDTESFIALMNERAAELGCTGTHFANCHGLPNDDHYSTANDLMLITKCALDKPIFKNIVSTASYTVPATNLSEPRELVSTNQLIRSETAYYYSYASGVKTGYTDAAGYCLISTAMRDGRTLIAVVLGGQSTTQEDGTTLIESFSESIRLLEWGFNNFSYQEIISTINLIDEIPVELGKGSSSVVLRPSRSITALLPNDVDILSTKLDIRIYNEENGETLYAPISQGSVLGEMDVTLDGVSYGTVPLIANTAVELNRIAYIKYQISSTLSNKYVRLGIIGFAALLLAYVLYIIIYNVNRRRKKAVADELARKRIAEMRRREAERSTTGKSFEEIEALHRRR